MSERQRQWCAAQIANLGNGIRASQICEPAVTRDKAAEMLNVSPRSVDNARVVRDHGVPELQAKVAFGDVARQMMQPQGTNRFTADRNDAAVISKADVQKVSGFSERQLNTSLRVANIPERQFTEQVEPSAA